MHQPRRIADFHRRYIPKWPDTSCVPDFNPDLLFADADDDDFSIAKRDAASSSSLRLPLKKLFFEERDTPNSVKSFYNSEGGLKSWSMRATSFWVWSSTPFTAARRSFSVRSSVTPLMYVFSPFILMLIAHFSIFIVLLYELLCFLFAFGLWTL